MQLTVHVVHIRHPGEQGMHWDNIDKELTSFKIVISFFCCSQCLPCSPPGRFFFTTRIASFKGQVGRDNFVVAPDKSSVLQENCQDSVHSKFNSNSGAPRAHEAVLENLVITWPYTDRPHHRATNGHLTLSSYSFNRGGGGGGMGYSSIAPYRDHATDDIGHRDITRNSSGEL